MSEATTIETVTRLTKDIKAAAKTLSAAEARYLVDTYYQMQRDRIRSDNQVRALDQADEPHATLSWLADNSGLLERNIRSALDSYSSAHAVGVWSKGVVGIGPVIAAGLIAHIDITKAPTVGHIWRFAGLDPTVTWEKKTKRPWNASLKTLCVRPGSFVTTDRGPTLIEQVRVGDRVLTHMGRWRRVMECFERPYSGEIIGLRSANAGNQVAWLTPGHPVIAAAVQAWTSGRTVKANERTREPMDWYPVEAIRPRWKIVRPRVETTADTTPLVLHLEGVDVGDGLIAAQGRWSGVQAPRAALIPARVEVDPAVGRLIGLYVAEGHVTDTYIGWSFHEDEVEHVRFVQAILRQRFMIEPYLTHNAPNRSVQVIAGAKPLAEAIAGACGIGSYDARLPIGWHRAPEDVRQCIWQGVMDGDGDRTGLVAGKRITTIQPALARELVDLGRQLGRSVSLHEEPLSGACRIHVNERDDQTPSARTSLSAFYRGPVYNLDVEEDHSYVVEGYAVHNCWKIGESFVKVSGNDDDVYGQLWLQRKAIEITRNDAGEFAQQAAEKLERFKIGKGTEAFKHYASGHLPPGHIHARAKRWAVKLFLAHWHAVAYRAHFGENAPKPYVISQLQHAHEIVCPNWPF